MQMLVFSIPAMCTLHSHPACSYRSQESLHYGADTAYNLDSERFAGKNSCIPIWLHCILVHGNCYCINRKSKTILVRVEVPQTRGRTMVVACLLSWMASRRCEGGCCFQIIVSMMFSV